MDRTWGAQEIKSELWGGLRGPWLDSLSSKNSKTISKTNSDTLRPFGWRRMTESGSELAESVLEVHCIPSEAPEERSDEGNHS